MKIFDKKKSLLIKFKKKKESKVKHKNQKLIYCLRILSHNSKTYHITHPSLSSYASVISVSCVSHFNTTDLLHV